MSQEWKNHKQGETMLLRSSAVKRAIGEKADAELIFFQVQKMYSTNKAQYFVFKNLLLFWNKTHKEYKTEKYNDNKITVTTIQVKK